MKRILLSLAVMFAFPLAADTAQAEKAIAKALDSPVNLELDENTTFEELIQMIKDKIPGINIVLDSAVIGINISLYSPVVDEPVSYQGAKLRSVLRLLLDKFDMTYLTRDDVPYLVQEDVLLLTTQDFAKACERRKMNHHFFLTPDQTVQQELEKVMDLIESVVNPESWNTDGPPMEYVANICFTPRLYDEGEEEPSITSDPPTAVLVADPTRLMNDTSPNTSGWGDGWGTTYDKTADYSEIMELIEKTETPAPRKYLAKKRCRLFRR